MELTLRQRANSSPIGRLSAWHAPRQNQFARAERRVSEAGGNIDEIERSIAERDLKDSTRADSPLQESADSVLVDTSNRAIDDIVNSIVALVSDRLK